MCVCSLVKSGTDATAAPALCRKITVDERLLLTTVDGADDEGKANEETSAAKATSKSTWVFMELSNVKNYYSSL